MTDAQNLPLEEIRVLDLSRALAGPFCAMILADFGADVVKVEPTPKGEMIRGWGPFDRGTSVYYLSVNRNKRSLALDFRDPDGLALLREPAARADVVIENFKPGVMEEMGLGWEQLRALNPRLVYAGITGFGREGPYGQWPGVDQIAQGMSGLMSITGQRDGPPTRVGVPIGDLVAGMWAAIGVHAALVQRQATGRGQRVETSLLASLVGLLCVQGQRYLSLEEVPKRQGNDHPVISPYGTFEASDGPFNMAAATEEMWLKLCGLLGLEELAEAPEFKDNSARVKNRDDLTRRLNERFRTRTRAEWTSEPRPARPSRRADLRHGGCLQRRPCAGEPPRRRGDPSGPRTLAPARQSCAPRCHGGPLRAHAAAASGRAQRSGLSGLGHSRERAAALIAKGTVRRAERTT